MQVVSDSQRKSSKGRLKVEKRIISFVYLCTGIQLLMVFAFIVKVTLGVNRTFQHSIFSNNDYALNPVLIYKTKTCNYTTVDDLQAFNGVSITLNAENANIVFADHALEMKSLFVLGLITMAFGIINRICIDIAFFSLKFRNMDIKKDIFSATELLLLTYLAQAAAFSEPRSALLRNYLHNCGVTSEKYLPWVSVSGLYVVVATGYFTYLVTLIIYLRNTLPKYGTMTPEEIEEYKAWLRLRKAEAEQSRIFIEQAKRAHARMFLLRNSTMPTDSSNLRNNLLHQPIPMNSSMPIYVPPMTSENVSIAETGLVHPHYDIYSNPGSAQNLPPPQMFGAQSDFLNYADTSYTSYLHQPGVINNTSGEFPRSSASNTQRQRNTPPR
ncbi:unnamed protein product [Phytomonas sp. EM1]|nr:unnamed protein product [Phytomonas sp. EM1]|eukprot:CCW64496.1 unnamed protein product [Phytomonas sp. isolate EM1]